MNIVWFLFSFNGRISRGPYWLFFLVCMVLILVPALLIYGGSEAGDDYVSIMSLILLWPNLAVQAKRWHDRDKSAWWLLINLIPLIGPFWALIENGFLSGTMGENRFGPVSHENQNET